MHIPHLISLIAAAFTAAWVLGLITRRIGLSPIVGYLLAGVVIGPFTPGFVGDQELASQLAEIGVILLMFGVGLHFHVADLLKVKKVAIPGAVGQSAIATLLGLGVAMAFGMPVKAGIVFGIALAVASTVVLIRGLTDQGEMGTEAGHVALGWLIVEDLLTVAVLVLIPVLGDKGGGSGWGVAATVGWAFAKLGVLVALVLVGGARVVPWVMVKVAGLRSRELFTLTVLVMSMAVAAGSAWLFGASMALGAFLAGVVVGQSPVSSQAAADVLPLRDAFAVLFFTAVGMLFDPAFLVREPLFVAAAAAVVLIGKPIAALGIVGALGYPLRTGVLAAVGLAQIGEFSFIVAELGGKFGLLSESANHAIVAVAIVSITVNPLLFKSAGPIEAFLRRFPWLAGFFDRGREGTRAGAAPDGAGGVEAALRGDAKVLAVIAGYGPVGRAVDAAVRQAGVETIVIDMNMATIQALAARGRAAIYGDATNLEVLSPALARATHLVVTLPDATSRNELIATAKLAKPSLTIYARARQVAEEASLRQAGADAARFEEIEVARALAALVVSELSGPPEMPISEQGSMMPSLPPP